MQLVSLNTWGGKVFKPLMEFIKTQALYGTDIFCFQEVMSTTSGHTNHHGYRANLLQELKELLPEYAVYYAPFLKRYGIAPGTTADYDLQVGQAVFVKRPISVSAFKEYIISGERFPPELRDDQLNTPVLLQKVVLKDLATVFNVHGTAWPGNKLDTPKRMEQSEKIISIMMKSSGPKILCGDFNLMPWTASIRMFDGVMINLIEKFDIKNTRGSLNIIDGKIGDQFFADFTFVSPGVKVLKFEVPDAKVSDHCPMITEFKLL